jgi:anti-sigma regulatory factor (Ser/Thr protein kinase)
MTPLELRVAADGRAPGVVRAALVRWLAARDWPEEDGEDVVFAVSEAVSNAAEHAYRHSRSGVEPGPLVVVLVTDVIDSDDRRAKIAVEDFGAWRSEPAGEGRRGHGLRMIAALMESCGVERGRSGTRITMISRPVRGRASNALGGQCGSRVPGAEDGG